MNAWESVFRQSWVNHGIYDENRLPLNRWEWPTGTWLQARLDHTRKDRSARIFKTAHKSRVRIDDELPAM
ncbi:MAG TPA: hypothetical protein VMT22_06700 [Terriglobales bacterium]|nr:hypothetical protein [Terriglobales bacterium]